MDEIKLTMPEVIELTQNIISQLEGEGIVPTGDEILAKLHELEPISEDSDKD